METKGEIFCLVLMIFVSEVLCSRGYKPPPVSSSEINIKECSTVQEQFVKDNLGHIYIVPDEKIHDPDMEICYKGGRDTNRKTCCSRKMERKYAHAAQRDYHDAIRLHTASLKNLLVSQSSQLQEKYQELIKLAENNTHTLFNQVYKVPLKERRAATQALFMDIQAFLKKRTVNLHETVSQFFDQLFPVVFHNILNDPVETELSDNYRECLAEARGQLTPHPFGDLPHKISHRLHYALAYAKTLFDALDIGIETVNTTDYIPEFHDCTKGLTRMKYCSHCESLVKVKPCENLCKNVLRGCLTPVLQVEGTWKSYVEGIEALVFSMNEESSLERTLQSLHSRISEAVMHAMESGPKFYAQVIAKCGHPKTSKLKQSNRDTSEIESSSKYMMPTKLKSSVTSQLDTFVRDLKVEKPFFDGMADQLCHMALFRGPKDNCWNGDNIGSYTKHVPAYNLTSQFRNPEVPFNMKREVVFAELSNKLEQITEVMKQKAKGQKKMQQDGSHDSNSYRIAGSGWSDDEDHDIPGSGSGNGYDEGSGYRRPIIKPDHGNYWTNKNSNKSPTDRDPGAGDLYFSKGNKNGGPQYKSDTPKAHENRNPEGGAVTHRCMSWLYVLTILTVGLWWGG